ncbi:hypothetical protein pb186bvf_002216 [Paramecium bursaria]
MKYDYRFLRQNQYFELPYIGLKTESNETPPLRSTEQKLKEFVDAQYEFYLPTFITPRIPKQETCKVIQTDTKTNQQSEEIVSPTLNEITYELKKSNPYQFTIPNGIFEEDQVC